MTALTATAARTTIRVGVSPRIIAAAAALRDAARALDAVFAGAATAPSRELPSSLALLRATR